ncbi:MAG TPA: hypothetical protein VLK30_07270 [Candidatus Limnocylindrales bacterium]|nr:hypothetical protein [Candidatus Limnocylindrales bacterium]
MPPTELRPDEPARGFLDSHPGVAWALDYSVHRCCGGGKICEVSVREVASSEVREGYVTTALPDGRRFLIDPRAARRLPSQVRLTMRGVGPWKRLDLELTGEQWGELLYT